MKILGLSARAKETSPMSSRRRILKLATGLPVSLPVFNLFASESGLESIETSKSSLLSYHLVQKQITEKGVNQGALVLVDSAIKAFSGNGYYLYPDWGQPVVYEVKQKGNRLTFHYPGLDSVLWQSRLTQENAQFSGRVEGILETDSQNETDLLQLVDSMPALQVPAFPQV